MAEKNVRSHVSRCKKCLHILPLTSHPTFHFKSLFRALSTKYTVNTNVFSFYFRNQETGDICTQAIWPEKLQTINHSRIYRLDQNVSLKFGSQPKTKYDLVH